MVKGVKHCSVKWHHVLESGLLVLTMRRLRQSYTDTVAFSLATAVEGPTLSPSQRLDLFRFFDIKSTPAIYSKLFEIILQLWLGLEVGLESCRQNIV
jgi:hypothetical protein